MILILILIPLSGLMLGLLLMAIMKNMSVEGRYYASPVLMSLAPIATIVLAVFLSFAAAPDPQSAFISFPNFTDILLTNVICTFLLSMIVVWLYRIKSFPYVISATLVNGLGYPLLLYAIYLLPSEVIREIETVLFQSALPMWGVVFAGYTAYYIHSHTMPSESNYDDRNNSSKIENMSDAEKFMAKHVETKEDLDS